MDQRDISDMLRRHRRQKWRPWRCRCGFRHPCPPRLLAQEKQVKLDTRARMEVVMEQLRRQAGQEGS
ncbi:hypothetical protein GCM10009835_22790 [Planosporangium flavigriseum]|uniref:Uncharacterized protein n=1 Tax=Planosporangium flavigriseum TaxID=373681 RepID=A0A8J3LQ76_9ACTN|nr:hypothetical protein Pfl04_43410 [Planosporangium flavigriseum]